MIISIGENIILSPISYIKINYNNNNKVMYNRNYYNNKINNDPEFYEEEKKRVVRYQVSRYNTDEEYREKKKEYSRNAMKKLYLKRKEEQERINKNS